MVLREFVESRDRRYQNSSARFGVQGLPERDKKAHIRDQRPHSVFQSGCLMKNDLAHIRIHVNLPVAEVKLTLEDPKPPFPVDRQNRGVQKWFSD